MVGSGLTSYKALHSCLAEAATWTEQPGTGLFADEKEGACKISRPDWIVIAIVAISGLAWCTAVMAWKFTPVEIQEGSDTFVWCEGEGDVVGVEAPLGGVAQVIFHGVQVVEVGVQVRVH